MIFAKIDYINLLPFYIYIKKNIRSNQVKAVINYKKSYPAYINKQFKNREIDAAFISSVESYNKKGLDLGIVAKDEVLSVLAIPGEYEKDFESATSNMLAKVLKIEGQVLIGDKALKYYHSHQEDEFIDLAKAWKNQYNLPFVFARLCYNNHGNYLNKITRRFDKRKIKIPQYILKQYAKRSGISEAQILNYLTKINYVLGIKEKKSLKLFLQFSNQIKKGN